MKSLIIITVLTALVACYEAADLPEGFSLVYDDTAVDGTIMSNRDLNERNQNFRLVYEARCTASAVVGRSKTSLVTYRGPSNVRINRIVINSPIQANIYHSALDTNNMEIRITSNVSRGVDTTVFLYQRSGAGRSFGEPAFHLIISVIMYFGYSRLA
uniref:REPAT15 n=1 Tax=Spodoptera exigua TaxID=7107 RepID=I0B5T5_SPOEX|nr:REPAT15 [Spodoptera exigua]